MITLALLVEAFFGTPVEEVFGTPVEDVFGTPVEDVFGTPVEDVFGTPVEDVFGTPVEDVFGTPDVSLIEQQTVKTLWRKAFWKAMLMWKDEREPKCGRLYKEHSSSSSDQSVMGNCCRSNSDGAHFPCHW